IAMTADVSGRSLGGVMTDVRRILAAHPPPAGVRMVLGGQYASEQEAFRALLLVLGIAAVSVCAVMVVQFESFLEPLVVLLVAPVSFVGALALLLVTGTALNVSSFMGLILLVGLIVKNGIILLDFTRLRMLAERLPLEAAIREAARVRLRPILMTTLCTLFGLLPLALGIGTGSELQRPLARAVIGGLTLSTPITLFAVPILLVAIRGPGYALPDAISPSVLLAPAYGSRTSSVKGPGTMLGRGRGRSGVGGGGGQKSAVTVKMRCVCSSSAKVRAPRRVVTFATTRNWLGPSSCTTVNVPSPFEENASAVPGSNAQPSTPAPIGIVVINLPALASEIAITWLRQPLNRR